VILLLFTVAAALRQYAGCTTRAVYRHDAPDRCRGQLALVAPGCRRLVLLPAVALLAVLPLQRGGSLGHVLLATAATPFYALGLLLAWR
jgi:hypothetical protein